MINKKNISPLSLEFQNITKGCYPSFVWQRRAEEIRENIPVFSFHTVEPEKFESQLQFLKNNQYHTLTSDEAYEFILNDKRPLEKAIMLTFDDGRKSVWTTIYPLLKKYGFKATVFLVPRILRVDERLTPNLEDVWQGNCKKETILNCDHGPSPTISWNEAKVMHESGVIDFQAHSLAHRRIPISSKIGDFVNPKLIEEYYFEFEIPLMKGFDYNDSCYEQFLGAPVYDSSPFLSGEKMVDEDIQLREECVQYISHNGGRRFFERKSWRKDLFDLVRQYRKKNLSTNLFETPEEQKKRIKVDFKKTKEIIESQLMGKKVKHFAFPWGAGSKLAIECSKEVGYVSSYWLTIPHKSRNLPEKDPFYIVRLKHDFIWRLPGAGRKSLREIFTQKFSRRVKGEIDY